MKHANRISAALAAALLVGVACPTSALAAHLTGGSNWSATYTQDGKMTDTYSTQEYIDQVSNLQPGDDITFEVKAIHANKDNADWYVSNDVVTTLEDSKSDAEGSNYEYLLQWEGPKQSRTIYDSQRVGGDQQSSADPEGLNEATEAMDEYIFLEQMKKGQSGKIILKVTLDGETEGDAYFDTLAQLKVRFAVEPVTEDTTERKREIPKEDRIVVRTGDETRLFPLYVAMFVSGIAIMGLLVWNVRDNRKNREEGTR